MRIDRNRSFTRVLIGAVKRRRLTGGTRARAGFTLFEVMVGASILAILGAVVIVTLSSYSDSKRVANSATLLRDLARSLNRYDSLLGEGASVKGRYPLLVSHLATPVTDTASTNCPVCRTSCGRGASPPAYSVYTQEHRENWLKTGPYFDRVIQPSVGIPTEIGLIRDTLVRVPAVTGAGDPAINQYGRLQIQVDSVLLADAIELQAQIDGDNDATVGTIRWTATPVDGVLAAIFYNIPVGGC